MFESCVCVCVCLLETGSLRTCCDLYSGGTLAKQKRSSVRLSPTRLVLNIMSTPATSEGLNTKFRLVWARDSRGFEWFAKWIKTTDVMF